MSGPIPVTDEDEGIFHEIHDRIVAPQNATVYREAAGYILSRWSAKALREANNAIRRQQKKDFPSLRLPSIDRKAYPIEITLARAGQTLLGEGFTDPHKYKNRHDLTKARAVLLLTWLWTEEAANQSEFGKDFGLCGDGINNESRRSRRRVRGGRSVSATMFLGYIRHSSGAEWRNWVSLVRKAMKVTEKDKPAQLQPPDVTTITGQIPQQTGRNDNQGHTNGNTLTLPKVAQKALQQYDRACEAFGMAKPLDREAYNWLAKVMKQEGEPLDSNFATWSRNLRTGRKATGQQKHHSRRARTGRSVVQQSDL